jgi:hypothetical protein
MKILKLILLYLVLNELIMKGNKQSSLIVVKNFCLYRNEIAKQETPSYFIKYLNKNLKRIINYDNSYVLVDFGCGDGTTLQKLNICKRKIGIEINKSIYNLAVNNSKYYANIELINADICNYHFNKNTILFMYEPLWLCKDYLKIYNKLFENILKCKKHIYIIYLTGLTKQLQEENFQKYNFKLKHKHKHGSILLNRCVYIYSN